MAPCFRPLVAAQLVLPAPAQDPCLALEDVANSTLSPPLPLRVWRSYASCRDTRTR